jgi:hypothetical protein
MAHLACFWTCSIDFGSRDVGGGAGGAGGAAGEGRDAGGGGCVGSAEYDGPDGEMKLVGVGGGGWKGGADGGGSVGGRSYGDVEMLDRVDVR